MPMLKKRGMVAEFYLTLDAIEHGNLTWDEVRRLAAAGNGIGAHDVHHFQLTALGPGRKSVSRKVMWTEINDVRQIIGAQIGVFPDSMAYVGGGYDARLQRLVEQAGYTSARGINRGVVQTPATGSRCGSSASACTTMSSTASRACSFPACRRSPRASPASPTRTPDVVSLRALRGRRRSRPASLFVRSGPRP